MSYSNFTLRKVQKELGIFLVEQLGLFANLEAHAISDYLRETLADNVTLATAINTEKPAPS